MVRDAASRCNRITGKHSNIRQSSTTISHEPVASPLWPCGSERAEHANWPCLCHVVQLAIIAHGRAWLVDMISIRDIAPSREPETVVLQGKWSGAAGLGARSQASMSRAGMCQQGRQPVTRPICLHCANDCQCSKGTESSFSS
jgi:hypothetical protein